MTVYLVNLPYSLTKADIRTMLAPYGPVGEIRIPKDHRAPRGYAFAQMSDDDALRAIAALDGQQVRGRRIDVREAKPLRTRRVMAEVQR